jgi:DNA ligase (NAD+)
MTHFVSRAAMDINAAEATIEALYNNQFVNDLSDLYFLSKDDVLTLDRFAEKSAQNLLDSIQESRNVPFPRVLYALGIRFVGETVAGKLAEHFSSIDNLVNAGYEELTAIDEIGPRIAGSILEFFSDIKNQKIIEKLKKAGVNLKMKNDRENAVSKKLTGKTIVISGTFESCSREAMKELIRQHGGKNASSVSSKTNILVAGRDPGPRKLEQANKNKVKIISEDDFLDMIGR